MRKRHDIGLRELCSASGGLLCLVLIIVPAQGGEQIQFSPPSSKSSLPAAKKQELRSDPDLFRSRGEAPGMDLPSTQQPESSTPSKRTWREFWDKQDKEKNWIFLQPSDFEPVTSPDKMFDVEDPEESNRPIRGSKVMERFWESQGADEPGRVREPSRAQGSDSDSSAKREGLESATQSEPSTAKAAGEEPEKAPAEWGRLFEERSSSSLLQPAKPNSLGEMFDAFGGSAGLFTTDGAGNDRPRLESNHRKEDLAEFQKLLKPGFPSAGKSAGNDPLNTAEDSTRQPLNPVLGRGSHDSVLTFQPRESLGGMSGLGSGGRGESAIGFSAFSGGGFSPAARPSSLFQSAEPMKAAPKPTTFEFPKRKF